MPEKINLLLAEDEPDVTEAYAEVLVMEGIRCRTSDNILTAIKIVEAGFSPDVAIIDGLLPGGRSGGFERESFGLDGGFLLCNWLLKNFSPMCRTIIWCGMEDFRLQAQRAGAWAYVVKPISLTEVPELWSAIKQGALLPQEMGHPTRKFSREDERMPD